MLYCVCFEDRNETFHIDLHREAGEAAASICEPTTDAADNNNNNKTR
jgi:hypothetical protein